MQGARKNSRATWTTFWKFNLERLSSKSLSLIFCEGLAGLGWVVDGRQGREEMSISSVLWCAAMSRRHFLLALLKVIPRLAKSAGHRLPARPSSTVHYHFPLWSTFTVFIHTMTSDSVPKWQPLLTLTRALCTDRITSFSRTSPRTINHSIP